MPRFPSCNLIQILFYLPSQHISTNVGGMPQINKVIDLDDIYKEYMS